MFRNKAKRLSKLIAVLTALAVSLGAFAGPVMANPQDQVMLGKLNSELRFTLMENKVEDTLLWRNKTIEQAADDGKAVENEFIITLEINTKEDVKEISIEPNLRAVLVMDYSASMDDVVDDKTALAKAQEAVNDFILDFGDVSEGVIREVSVVKFGVGAYIAHGWTDVSKHTRGVNALTVGDWLYNNNTFNRNGTNIQAGLRLAERLVNEGANSNVETLIVLLSDGAPNRIGTGNVTAVGTGANRRDAITGSTAGSSDFLGVFSGTATGSNSRVNNSDDSGVSGATPRASFAAHLEAKRLIEVEKIDIYVVYFHTNATGFGPNNNTSHFRQTVFTHLRSVTNARTALEAYLREFIVLEGPSHPKDKSRLFTSSQVENNLGLAFSAALESIKINAAHLWYVEDKLPPYMHWRGMVDVPGYSNVMRHEDGTVIWDVYKSTHLMDGDYFTYKAAFRVRIDNTMNNGYTVFQGGQSKDSEKGYHSNVSADLTYTFLGPEETTDFPMPEVSVYNADLPFRFRKIDSVTRAPIPEAEFHLVLKPGGPAISDYSKQAEINKDGYFSFRNIPSGYDYILRETIQPGYAGYPGTIDVADVEVKWGIVIVTVNGERIEDDYVIENTPKTGSVEIEGTKILKDNVNTPAVHTLANHPFSFILEDKDGVPIDKAMPDIENGGFKFGAIHYTPADIGKTFEYTVREFIPDEGNKSPGITYDDETLFNVTVKVEDVGDTELRITQKIWREGTEVFGIKFENEYNATRSAVINVTKILTGKELNEDMFSFTLEDKDGVLETVRNNAEGVFSFSEIPYDKAGTYVYTVKEVDNGVRDIIYDGTVFVVTIVVTDDGDGNLTAVQGIVAKGEGGEEPIEEIVFTNIYAPAALSVTKTALDFDAFANKAEVEIDGDVEHDTNVIFAVKITNNTLGVAANVRLTDVFTRSDGEDVQDDLEYLFSSNELKFAHIQGFNPLDPQAEPFELKGEESVTFYFAALLKGDDRSEEFRIWRAGIDEEIERLEGFINGLIDLEEGIYQAFFAELMDEYFELIGKGGTGIDILDTVTGDESLAEIRQLINDLLGYLNPSVSRTAGEVLAFDISSIMIPLSGYCPDEEGIDCGNTECADCNPPYVCADPENCADCNPPYVCADPENCADCNPPYICADPENCADCNPPYVCADPENCADCNPPYVCADPENCEDCNPPCECGICDECDPDDGIVDAGQLRSVFLANARVTAIDILEMFDKLGMDPDGLEETLAQAKNELEMLLNGEWEESEVVFVYDNKVTVTYNEGGEAWDNARVGVRPPFVGLEGSAGAPRPRPERPLLVPPTPSPTPTPSPEPPESPSPSPPESPSPTPSESPSPSPSESPSPTPSESPSPTPSESPSPSPTPTSSPTPDPETTEEPQGPQEPERNDRDPAPDEPEITPVEEAPEAPPAPDVPFMEFNDDGVPTSVWRDGMLNELVQQPDGTFMEFDHNGVPLGTWAPNENGVFEFTPAVPLGTLPATGELGISLLLGVLGLLFLASGLLMKRRRNAV